jgi:hypothetical protein
MTFTQEHIDIILSGIEKGYNIQKCCKELLGVHSNNFYRYATKEQKDVVKTHKLLNAGLRSSYERLRKVLNHSPFSL